MRWGCLLTLGVFVYGAAAVEPIMNGLRNLLSGLFGADSFVRRFAESFLEGVADHTTQTRGAVAAVLGARSVISGKITARLVMIAAIPFFSDLTYGWTESWYMDHSLFDWADFVRGVMVVITLAIIGVWGFLAIGIRTGSRPYLMPNPDIAQIGEQTLAMDRWISKAGIVTVIGLVIVPVLLCGWAKVKMEYEGSKVASARFDHISDCEDLGSDHEEYDTCLLMVMNKSETEQAELAIVAERTRARQAKKSKVAEAE